VERGLVRERQGAWLEGSVTTRLLIARLSSWTGTREYDSVHLAETACTDSHTLHDGEHSCKKHGL
jgi:hypothetical protein